MRARSILGIAALSAACGGESFVEGKLRLGDLENDATGYQFAEIRAFPEYTETFDIRRIYAGDEVLSQSTTIGSVDLPPSFRLDGYDIGDPGGPWRIIAWLTNREDSTWVGTNEPYGTRTFTFDCKNGPVCAIRGVDVDVDRVAPPN